MVRYPCWLVIMPPRVKYGVFGMKSLECEINARVPKTMFDAATALAEQSDQTTGEIVRRALAQYLNRQKAKAAAGAAGSQIDEGLRQIVQDSLAASTDWQSFQSGLRANGYEVFPMAAASAFVACPTRPMWRKGRASARGSSHPLG